MQCDAIQRDSAEATGEPNIQSKMRVNKSGSGSGDIETIITNAIETSNIVTVKDEGSDKLTEDPIKSKRYTPSQSIRTNYSRR